MWTRQDLKFMAKDHLRGRYWFAFAVSLVVSILAGGSNMFTWRFDANDFKSGNFNWNNFNWDNFNWNNFYNGEWQDIWKQIPEGAWSGLIAAAVMVGLIALFVGIAYGIFVKPVVEVGGNRWFSRNRESTARPLFSQVFSLFRRASYLKTVCSMLWMNLFIFLWSLLFIIPGIIKSYSYRMTPWILADNPLIDYRRALKLSMDLTRGHKWNIFVLDLSFIGWFILGTLACGVGTLFVMPYYMAVQAELYATLRQDGVNRGLTSMEEFGYTRVDAPQLQV